MQYCVACPCILVLLQRRPSAKEEAAFDGSSGKLYQAITFFVGCSLRRQSSHGNAALAGSISGTAEFFGTQIDMDVFPDSVFELIRLLQDDGGAELLKNTFPCDASDLAYYDRSGGKIGDDQYFHVAEFVTDSTTMVLVPKLNQIMIAVREILAGQAWVGAQACFSLRDSATATSIHRVDSVETLEIAESSLLFAGSAAVAVYGTALSLVALVAARMHVKSSGDGSDFEIPHCVQQAAQRTRGFLVQAAADPKERIWSQYEATTSASLLNVRPSEFDLRKSILDLKKYDESLTAKQCVEEYQARQAKTPERKLRGNAPWRMANFVDEDKFCLNAIAKIQAALELVDFTLSPVSATMTANEDLYIGSQARKGHTALSKLTVLPQQGQIALVSHAIRHWELSNAELNQRSPANKLFGLLRERAALTHNLATQILPLCGLPRARIDAIKSGFDAMGQIHDSWCRDVDAFVTTAEKAYARESPTVESDERRLIVSIVLAFDVVKSQLAEMEAERREESESARKARDATIAGQKLVEVKQQLSSDIVVAQQKLPEFRAVKDAAATATADLQHRVEARVKDASHAAMRLVEVQRLPETDGMDETAAQNIREMKAKILETCPGAIIKTIFGLDMKPKFVPSDAFSERCGRLLRSETMKETDLLLYFPPENSKTTSTLEKTKLDVLDCVFGRDRSAFVCREFMLRRSEENRRPKESGITIGRPA